MPTFVIKRKAFHVYRLIPAANPMKKKLFSLFLGSLFLSSLPAEEDPEQRRVREGRESDVRRESPREGDRGRPRQTEGRVIRRDGEGDRRTERALPPKPRLRGEGDRPPPPNVRREGDRPIARPLPRDGERPRPPLPFIRGDREGERDRPVARPPFQRDSAPRLREGDRPNPLVQRDADRREVLIQVLRDELRRSQELNAELRSRMQLLEQRLNKLEKR